MRHHYLAEWLIGAQNRLHFALLLFLQAVLDLLLPVARLLLDVEGKTGRATNGLQTLF